MTLPACCDEALAESAHYGWADSGMTIGITGTTIPMLLSSSRCCLRTGTAMPNVSAGSALTNRGDSRGPRGNGADIGRCHGRLVARVVWGIIYTRYPVALAAFGGHPGFGELAKPAAWQRRPGIRSRRNWSTLPCFHRDQSGSRKALPRCSTRRSPPSPTTTSFTHAWWKVNLSATDLLSYLRSHQVKGLLSTGTGGSVTGPNQPR